MLVDCVWLQLEKEQIKTVKEFYISAGQNLEIWTPPAPKVKKDINKDLHNLDDAETMAAENVLDLQEKTP